MYTVSEGGEKAHTQKKRLKENSIEKIRKLEDQFRKVIFKKQMLGESQNKEKGEKRRQTILKGPIIKMVLHFLKAIQ